MQTTELKILLIDDDEDEFVELRDVLSDISRPRYDLIWKAKFEEGVAALRTGGFDACIVDYRLDGRTGLELMAEAQRLEIECPMILLTGYGDLDLDFQAMEAGAADYLVKGQISTPLLERSIRYAIKNAKDLRAIADERENFHTLFNSTFEGILVHSQGKISAANRAARDIFNCTEELIVGKDLSSFVREDYRESLREQLATGKDLQMECVGLTSDGDEIYLGIAGRTISLNGRWASLLAVRDLTERKTMETQILQQDRLASLGLLASSLAHEIGTPLGVIRGRAELVQKSADPKTSDTMRLIVGQIDRIAKLVNSLLHIARNKNSHKAYEVSLRAVVADVINLLSHELDRNNIQLHVDIPNEQVVLAEPEPLGQVFLNLVVNAIYAITSKKTAARGAISISSAADARTVQIKVIDNGVGIAEKDLSRLFQPFFTTKDVGEGTGLGLATSYKIISSWDGAIAAESKLGQGSTFTVTLRK